MRANGRRRSPTTSPSVRKRRWRNPSTIVLLDDLAVRQLHLHMFGDVWTWAGQYRTREVNIGIAPEKISVAVRALVDDARVWLGESDPVHLDRAVCRLHHRLVQIHPFVNGNGRLARAYSDLVLVAMGQPAFTWGRLKAKPLDEVRAEYLSALRQADAGDLKPLEEFVRT